MSSKYKHAILRYIIFRPSNYRAAGNINIYLCNHNYMLITLKFTCTYVSRNFPRKYNGIGSDEKAI